jgi:hypothetical protein
MGYNFEDLMKRIRENGKFEIHIGNYKTREEAIDALQKGIAPGGNIKAVLQQIDEEFNLNTVNIDIEPVQNADGEYDIYFSCKKAKKRGGI